MCKETKIDLYIYFIKLYKKNIRFIKSRIAIQNKDGYDKFEGGLFPQIQYTQFDVDIQMTKLNNVKTKLEEI